MVAPAPAQFVVAVVDVAESFQNGLDGAELAVDDVVDEELLLSFGQKQSGKVNPVAFALGRFRLYGFVPLEHGAHVDAKRQVVVLDAFAQ